MDNKFKVSPGTIARTILLVLAFINQILTATGHSVINIEDETVEELVSSIFTIVIAIVAWWKNNSFTQAALTADDVMNRIKDSENDAIVSDEDIETEDDEESDEDEN
jgi:SPP1 family holin